MFTAKLKAGAEVSLSSLFASSLKGFVVAKVQVVRCFGRARCMSPTTWPWRTQGTQLLNWLPSHSLNLFFSLSVRIAGAGHTLSAQALANSLSQTPESKLTLQGGVFTASSL